jgi:peptide/nickel transport system substrate-binding protein
VNTSTPSRLPVDASDPISPIIFYDRRATCWQPRVKGLTIMVNSIANGARMEAVWLDQ